jgi:hypothetical protein
VSARVAKRLGLRAVTAAAHRRAYVVLVQDLEQLEALARDHSRRFALEVVVGGTR